MQTAISWLKQEINKSIIPAQKDYFNWAFDEAEKMERENIESLILKWAKLREEAKNLGIQLGIRLGVQNSEEFWNKWDELIQGDDFPSEDEVMNECIDIIFNTKQ